MSNIAILKTILITLLLAAGLSCIPLSEIEVRETIMDDFIRVATKPQLETDFPSGYNELRKLKDDMFNAVVEVKLYDGRTISEPYDPTPSSDSGPGKKEAKMVVNYVAERGLKYSRLTSVISSIPFKELISYTGNVYVSEGAKESRAYKGPYLFEQNFVKNLDQLIIPGKEYPIKSMIALYASLLANVSMLNNLSSRSHCMVRPQAFGLKDGYMNFLNVSGAAFLGACGNMHMATIPPEYYTWGITPTQGRAKVNEIFRIYQDQVKEKSYMDGYAATLTFFFLLRKQIKGAKLDVFINKAVSNIRILDDTPENQTKLEGFKKNMKNYFPNETNKILDNIEDVYVNLLNVLQHKYELSKDDSFLKDIDNIEVLMENLKQPIDETTPTMKAQWADILKENGEDYFKNMVQQFSTGIRRDEDSLADNALIIDVFEQIVLYYIKDELLKLQVFVRDEEKHKQESETDVCGGLKNTEHPMSPSRLMKGEAINNFLTTINNQLKKFIFRKKSFMSGSIGYKTDKTRVKSKFDAQKLAVNATGTLILLDYLEYNKYNNLSNDTSDNIKKRLEKLPGVCDMPKVQVNKNDGSDLMHAFFHSTYLTSSVKTKTTESIADQCQFSYEAIKGIANYKAKDSVDLIDKDTFKMDNVKTLIDNFKACGFALSKVMHLRNDDKDDASKETAKAKIQNIISTSDIVNKIAAGVKSLRLDPKSDNVAGFMKVANYLKDHLAVFENEATSSAELLLI